MKKSFSSRAPASRHGRTAAPDGFLRTRVSVPYTPFALRFRQAKAYAHLLVRSQMTRADEVQLARKFRDALRCSSPAARVKQRVFAALIIALSDQWQARNVR